MQESGGVSILNGIENDLHTLRTWLPQTQDEVMQTINNKVLRECIEKLYIKIRDDKPQEFSVEFYRQFVEKELKKMLDDTKR